MKLIVDLHIHSRFSRATSKTMNLEELDFFARKKGVQVLGTGDFTHPKWMQELSDELEPAEEGLYVRKGHNKSTRFLFTVEISCIYSKGGKVRKVHVLLFAPNIEAAKKLNVKLRKVGNIHSDGRPILGIDVVDLAKLAFEISPDFMVVPAHCWTPWFSVFGSKSGFDSLEECFGDITPMIHAIETGLSCYDRETEVLTQDGWKPFFRARSDDRFCTLNPDTEEITYQRAQKIYRSRYRGKMYHLKTKRVDLLVTPNHNLLYAPADFHAKRSYRFKKAEELFGKSKLLRKDGIWKGRTPNFFILPEVKMRHGSKWYSGLRTKAAKQFAIEPWLKFFGFWIAEGWATEGKNGDYAVCVSNLDNSLMTEMKGILEDFGYNVFWDKKIAHTLRVRDYQLFYYLRQFGKASDKYIPPEVKDLSKELIEIFFEYYIKGDGHRYGRAKKGLSATTISVHLRDDLQEIALKMEISAYYKLLQKKGTLFPSQSNGKEYRQSADSWTIYFIRHNRHAIIPSEMKKYGHKEEWVNYDGMVYCVSVPNRTLYIRRNGIPVWCGNSDPAMNWRLSQLDSIALISNSDCHSSRNIAREANVFDCKLSYAGIMDSIKAKDPKQFLYTIEFFPEEGKYHYDGHRDCKFSVEPSKRASQACPVCGRPMTIGVLSRVEDLADRPQGFVPKNAVPFKGLVALDKIIGDVIKVGNHSKAVQREYEKLLEAFGNELKILLDVPLADLQKTTTFAIAQAITRVREGKVFVKPGYDGVYGKIHILNDEEKSPQLRLL